MRWAGRLGHEQAAHPDPEEQAEQDRGQKVDPGLLEHRCQPGHGEDEADRTPQAHDTVAMAARPEVREGHGLELRQGGVPEEAEARHDQRQTQVTVPQVHAGEKDHREQRGRPDDGHAPARAVGDPAPDVGRDQFGAHEDGDQLTDGRAVEAERAQVQAPVGNEGAEGGEIEEIEGRQPRVEPPFHRWRSGFSRAGRE